MLTFGTILSAAGIDPAEAPLIRHVFIKEHGDSSPGILPESTDERIMEYTTYQSISTKSFPAQPPRFWIVFIAEGSNRARLWSVVENHGLVSTEEHRRVFDLTASDAMADLNNRLVISWKSPRAWKVKATTAATYPILEIADAAPIPFPGFDELVLDYTQLQAVMREHRYAAWRTALASVLGVYLITDTRDGRQYIGKADGEERISQRWSTYAANGHGGNVELRGLDPTSFRYSLLRVFDPATPDSEIDAAESHFKQALDTRRHGLNRN
ncbi:GIY-YIG nuclease family protein [Rothia koreensis]|uniref:GIY-YIG nuclease family protein n=1 Tax=Rothia koreensis TaxID=592378 RepID=UPI0037CBF0E0